MVRPVDSTIDSKTHYVRPFGDEWEYGYYDYEKKRVKLGVMPTYEEALAVNNMALAGKQSNKRVFA